MSTALKGISSLPFSSLMCLFNVKSGRFSHQHSPYFSERSVIFYGWDEAKTQCSKQTSGLSLNLSPLSVKRACWHTFFRSPILQLPKSARAQGSAMLQGEAAEGQWVRQRGPRYWLPLSDLPAPININIISPFWTGDTTLMHVSNVMLMLNPFIALSASKALPYVHW